MSARTQPSRAVGTNAYVEEVVVAPKGWIVRMESSAPKGLKR